MKPRHTHFQLLAAILLCAAALILTLPTVYADDGSGYAGPDTCKPCHAKEVEAWANAPHADAAKRVAFVEAWQAAKSPGYCLSCHTTGYDPNTGQYAFEGVTCESCHGMFVADHPKTAMSVDTTPQACGRCHKSTLNEWEISKHGRMDIGCVACHDVHGGKTKTEISNDLCKKCHSDTATDVAHASSSGKGLSCADCHIGPRTGDPTEGHANTGHTFMVGTETCSRCHADQIHKGVQAMMGADPARTAAAPAADSAATESAAPSGAGSLALPVVGSVLIGAALGFGWARLSKPGGER